MSAEEIADTPKHVLENQGSTARDHLANERTFLAWVRTGLGVIGLGVILQKLVDAESAVTRGAGVVLIMYGVAMLGYSLQRYDRVRGELEKGRFPVAKRGPVLIGALALLIAVGALVLLWV